MTYHATKAYHETKSAMVQGLQSISSQAAATSTFKKVPYLWGTFRLRDCVDLLVNRYIANREKIRQKLRQNVLFGHFWVFGVNFDFLVFT